MLFVCYGQFVFWIIRILFCFLNIKDECAELLLLSIFEHFHVSKKHSYIAKYF